MNKAEIKIKPMTEYELGQWDMFESVTSFEYGKQRFYLQDNGIVFDRQDSEYMNVEQAYRKYFDEINMAMSKVY